MSLTHLILGMLAERPMTGYDLNKAFEGSAAHFWTTDQSQIYRTLHKLRKQKWVTVTQIHQTDKPNKKVYELTDAGREALQVWLKQPLSPSEAPIREGWLGQLFFGHHLDDATLITLLQTYIDQTQANLDALENIDAELRQLPPEAQSRALTLRQMTLNYGLHIQTAFRDWLIAAQEQINQMEQPPEDSA